MLVLAHVVRKVDVLRVAGELLCYTHCEWYTTSYSNALSPSTGADVSVFVPLPSPQSIHREQCFQHVVFLCGENMLRRTSLHRADVDHDEGGLQGWCSNHSASTINVSAVANQNNNMGDFEFDIEPLLTEEARNRHTIEAQLNSLIMKFAGTQS